MEVNEERMYILKGYSWMNVKDPVLMCLPCTFNNATIIIVIKLFYKEASDTQGCFPQRALSETIQNKKTTLCHFT